MDAEQFIVKIQRSITTNAKHPMMLIYSEDGSKAYEGRLTKSVKKLMGDKLKAFFRAHMDGTFVVIDEEAEWQEW